MYTRMKTQGKYLFRPEVLSSLDGSMALELVMDLEACNSCILRRGTAAPGNLLSGAAWKLYGRWVAPRSVNCIVLFSYQQGFLPALSHGLYGIGGRGNIINAGLT